MSIGRRGGWRGFWAVVLAFGGWAQGGTASPLPTLSIVPGTNGTVVLSWPVSAEGFLLERSVDLPSSAGWQTVAEAATTEGGMVRLALPRGATTQFYRLRRPVDLPGLLLEYGARLAEDNALQGTLTQAYPDVPFLDPFEPWIARPLTFMAASPGGAMLLAPGLSETWLETYCVKTATGAPGAGTGYLPGPFVGPRADIVQRIAGSAPWDPAGTQEQRQILIWAVLMRTPVSLLPAPVRELAARVLSTSDLERLEVAVAGRRAVEAEYTERIVEAFLGVGGLFADLPADFRAALLEGGALERALRESANLSYEDMQQLAFTESLFGEPFEPGREIPYGRWAWVPISTNPPSGYLARYLVETYDLTHVQYYRGESITVTEDDLGRILAIEDAPGNRLEVTYDPALAPLRYEGDPGVVGYALASIRWVGPPDPEDPRVLPEASYVGAGWVLSGMPASDVAQVPAAGAAARYREAAARHAWTVAQRAELTRLEGEFDRLLPGRSRADALTLSRLMRLAELCEGVRWGLGDAMAEDDPGHPLVADRMGLVFRAWASVFQGMAVGQPTVDLPAVGPVLQSSGKRWKTPKANEVWERELDRVDTLVWLAAQKNQSISVSPRKAPAAEIDRQAAWEEYKGWTGKVLNAVDQLTSDLIGYEAPWSVPLQIFKPILDGTVYLWLMAGAKLATLDPPRNDFTTLAEVSVPETGPVPEVAGISAERLAAARRLLPLHLRLGACLQACSVTYDRVGGAFQAGDPAWAARQAGRLAELEYQAGRLMLDTADATEDWIRVIRDEGAEDAVIRRAGVIASRERWRVQGLSAETVAALRQFGLSDADLEECRRAAADVAIPPEDFFLFGSMDEQVAGLRSMGRRLMGLAAPGGP